MPITLFDNGSHKCIAFPDLVTCDGFKDEADEGKTCDSVQANQFLIAWAARLSKPKKPEQMFGLFCV
jgi:hypothetical protein